jgi:hypothetical protein
LFWVEKTTSGQPSPLWSKRLIFVWNEPEPSAPPSYVVIVIGMSGLASWNAWAAGSRAASTQTSIGLPATCSTCSKPSESSVVDGLSAQPMSDIGTAAVTAAAMARRVSLRRVPGCCVAMGRPFGRWCLVIRW